MTYPNLLRRYLASLLDMLAVLFLVYLYSRSPWYEPGSNAGGIVFIVALLSYEPLATSFYCTLGQAVMRFRVRNMADSGRINPPQAYVRLLVKYALGILSFLTMPVRPDRRAIHDLAAGSIVVEASAVRVHERLQSDRP